jgi:hypothetical protein
MAMAKPVQDIPKHNRNHAKVVALVLTFSEAGN